MEVDATEPPRHPIDLWLSIGHQPKLMKGALNQDAGDRKEHRDQEQETPIGAPQLTQDEGHQEEDPEEERIVIAEAAQHIDQHEDHQSLHERHELTA